MKKNKLWWQIIKDDSKRTFDIIGKAHDDTLLTNNVCEMIKSGMSVQCTTPPYTGNESEDDLAIPGYKKEPGLYQRLVREYETKTRKSLRMW